MHTIFRYQTQLLIKVVLVLLFPTMPVSKSVETVEHKLAANTFSGLTAVVCSQIIVVVVKTQTLASPVFCNDLSGNFLD